MCQRVIEHTADYWIASTTLCDVRDIGMCTGASRVRSTALNLMYSFCFGSSDFLDRGYNSSNSPMTEQ